MCKSTVCPGGGGKGIVSRKMEGDRRELRRKKRTLTMGVFPEGSTVLLASSEKGRTTENVPPAGIVVLFFSQAKDRAKNKREGENMHAGTNATTRRRGHEKSPPLTNAKKGRAAKGDRRTTRTRSHVRSGRKRERERNWRRETETKDNTNDAPKARGLSVAMAPYSAIWSPAGRQHRW